mgnify:CR=1 FL=1
MRRKYAMYPGRFQTWHAGHEWLIRQQLDKGKNVWIAIRDVEIDEDNLFTAHEVLMKLTKEPFIMENTDKIMISIIPDIESVNYGRGVGYDVIFHEPPKEISDISGTAIRQHYMDSNGDVIVYNVDTNGTSEETHS